MLTRVKIHTCVFFGIFRAVWGVLGLVAKATCSQVTNGAADANVVDAYSGKGMLVMVLHPSLV
jgi:hypothetical protein